MPNGRHAFFQPILSQIVWQPPSDIRQEYWLESVWWSQGIFPTNIFGTNRLTTTK
jgi:hypothetical protein